MVGDGDSNNIAKLIGQVASVVAQVPTPTARSRAASTRSTGPSAIYPAVASTSGAARPAWGSASTTAFL